MVEGLGQLRDDLVRSPSTEPPALNRNGTVLGVFTVKGRGFRFIPQTGRPKEFGFGLKV